MDDDRLEGAARSLKGHAKDAVGGLAGDNKMQAEGKADQVAGDLQNQAGQVADMIREQPITALLIAAGVGYLVGRIGRWI